MSKTSFPTSIEVYNQIRTDNRLQAHLGVITYYDNIKKKYINVSVPKFVPISKGGDIPWHRVWYIKYNGKIVWDRKERICVIKQICSTITYLPLCFSILTFNVMNEKHIQDKSEITRATQILSYILNCNADIICLQEVCPKLLDMLQTNASNTYPSIVSTDLLDDNIVFLSKYTILFSDSIQLGKHKESLVVTLEDEISHLKVNIVGIHFTSDHQNNANVKRAEQLQKIITHLQEKTYLWVQACIIVGDFNGEPEIIIPTQLVSIDEQYVTYDPINNYYAKMMSKSKLDRCLDRVLYTSKYIRLDHYNVDKMQVLSDHYPLYLKFHLIEELGEQAVSLSKDLNIKSYQCTTNTALVIIVPVSEWSKINPIRERYDPAFERWMPHITLAHGFLQLDQLDQFFDKFKTIQFESFNLNFSIINYFQHDKSTTYYLEPSNESKLILKSVYSKLSSIFPQIFDKTDYMPHITLSSQLIREKIHISFFVEHFHIVEKRPGTKYYQTVLSLPLKRLTSSTYRNVLEILKMFPSSTPLEWNIVGSTVFEEAHRRCSQYENLSNDLDLVVSGNQDSDSFYVSLEKYLKTCGYFLVTQLINNEHLTYLKTNYMGLLDVDIQYLDLNNPNMNILGILHESTRILEIMSKGIIEDNPLLETKDVFLHALFEIKKAAKASQIYGASHGFISGIGWTILTAYFCQNNPNVDKSFPYGFAQYYANYDWPKPITLLEHNYNTKSFCDKFATIIATTPPHDNVLRTLTKSTIEIILNVFKRGFVIEDGNSHKVILDVTGHTVYYQSMWKCRNMLKILLPKILIKFERKLGYIRPYEITQIGSFNNDLAFSWSIGFIRDSSVIRHYFDELVGRLQSNFPHLSIDYKFVSLKEKGRLPSVILFVGYPGSGKTILSKHICDNNEKFVRINQDEMGRQPTSLIRDKILIVDACNLTREKRRKWIELTKSIWCIFLDIDIEECKYRIERRVDHPTVKNGLSLLEELNGKLERPELKEGFKKIIRIIDQSDIDNLLSIVEIKNNLIIDNADVISKYPRTKHLINFGSVSRDDLIFSKEKCKDFLDNVLFIEEKLDGANIGIRINKDYKIIVQNRSHYVDSSYHPQFKLLDKWISEHSGDLFDILEIENEILFGEWLYMCHSIHYTKLPDYFIAFDIFNSKSNKFLSRNKLEDRLKGTNIKIIPLLSKKKVTRTELIELLKIKSAYYDGFVEGLYLRICDENRTLNRGKIVRADFINNQAKHWDRGNLRKNIIEQN